MMQNGNYTITNTKTGSKLIVQITDSGDASIVQKDAAGNKTAQQARTRAEAVTAVERAKAAGMPIEFNPLKDILGNEIK